MGIIILYVTYPNIKEATKITHHLINKKLISCANFSKVKSFFSWKGKIESSNEIASVIKTKKENWAKVKSEIKKMHSYEIPCILKIAAEANKEFESWVISETK